MITLYFEVKIIGYMTSNRDYVKTKLKRQKLDGCNFGWSFLNELVIASDYAYHCGKIFCETPISSPVRKIFLYNFLRLYNCVAFVRVNTSDPMWYKIILIFLPQH